MKGNAGRRAIREIKGKKKKLTSRETENNDKEKIRLVGQRERRKE